MKQNQVPVFTMANIIYWLFTAILISLTTHTLGRAWKRHENYRWTTGYAAVFLPGAMMVPRGHWDLTTWAGLFFAVGISGVIKVGHEQYVNSRAAERIRRGGDNGRQTSGQ